MHHCNEEPAAPPKKSEAGPSRQRSTTPPRSRSLPVASRNTAPADFTNLPETAVSSTVSHIVGIENSWRLESTDNKIQSTYADFKQKIAVASRKAAQQRQRQGSARPRNTKKTAIEMEVEMNMQRSETQYAKARRRSKKTKPDAQRAIAVFGRGSAVATNLLERHADAKAQATEAIGTHSHVCIIAGCKLDSAGKWQAAVKHYKTGSRMLAKAEENHFDERAQKWRIHRDTLRQGDGAFDLSPQGRAVNAGYRHYAQRYRKARQFSKGIREEYSGTDSSDSETSYSDVERN